MLKSGIYDFVICRGGTDMCFVPGSGWKHLDLEQYRISGLTRGRDALTSGGMDGDDGGGGTGGRRGCRGGGGTGDLAGALVVMVEGRGGRRRGGEGCGTHLGA